MKAIKGESSLARSPEDYVAEHFDSFADGFDAKLVGVLGYDVPEKLCSAVRRITPAGRKYIALDAGCDRLVWSTPPSFRESTDRCGSRTENAGTSREARCLRRAAPRRINIISEPLAAAFRSYRRGGCRYLHRSLLPVFTAAANAIQPGGLLAFSTEFWSGEVIAFSHPAASLTRPRMFARWPHLIFTNKSAKVQPSGWKRALVSPDICSCSSRIHRKNVVRSSRVRGLTLIDRVFFSRSLLPEALSALPLSRLEQAEILFHPRAGFA